MILGLACAIAVADAPATVPSTKPSADKDDPTVGWNLLPQLPARPINKVVHFAVVQGILTADWPILDSGPVNGHFNLTGLPGAARIQCIVSRKPPFYAAPMFEYYNLTSEGVCPHLQVLSLPLKLQVIQDYETATRFETTSLLESLDQADAYTLRVQVTENSQQKLNLVFSAPTLAALRDQHPLEFEKYLRPLFAQYQQEDAILAGEDKIGWQVMAGDWQQPPDLAARVQPLVDQLNSADYSQRAQAQASLHELGEPAALYLHFTDPKQWTAEQFARIHKFLTEYFVLTDDQAAKLGGDPNFLLNCLESDDAALRAAALKHLERVLGRKIEYKLDQPRDDRMTAVEQLRREIISRATTRSAAE